MKRKTLLLIFFVQLFGVAYSKINNAEKIILNRVVYEWSDSHNNGGFRKLNELYAPNVLFYCGNLKKGECIATKKKLLNSTKSFHQNIIPEVTYVQYRNNVILASFTKQVNSNNKTNFYPSYLLLFKYKEKYLIVGESDAVTDRNLKFHLDVYKLILPSSKAKATTIKPAEAKRPLSYIRFGFSIIGLIIIFILIYFIKKRKRPLDDKELKNEPPVNSPIMLTPEVLPSIESTKNVSNENKGLLFEEYIVKKFDRKYFNLKEWRGDKYIDGKNPIYAESNNYPDLLFEFNRTDFSKKFAVECKFRSNFINGAIEFKDSQLKNYKKYESENNIEVYIVFGVGGKPEDPKDLYLVPLSKITTTTIKIGALSGYSKATGTNFFYKKEIPKLT